MAKNETMDFSAFMAGSAIAAEPVEYVASKRFKGKDGKPAKWKIQPFSASENDKLTKEFTRKVRLPSGERKNTFDNDRYNLAIVTKAVIYPNLNDPALQDSYGVMSAEELVQKMLLPGELVDLQNAIAQVLGFENDIADDIKTAKN